MTDRTSPRPTAAPLRTTPTVPSEGTALLPAVALGVVLVLDVVRVWMPSVIFIYGRAGSTPATELGAFALAWVVAGLVAAGLVRLVRPGTAFVATAALLASTRLLLQLWDGGGDVQLLTASVGWVAATAFVGALAAGATSRPLVGAGLAVGLAGDAALRAATGSVELTWLRGSAGTVAGTALVVAFLVAVARARPALAAERRRDLDPAWPWLGVGLVLVLHGVLAGTPSRLTAAIELSPTAAAMLTVASLGLGAAWALAAPALAAARGASTTAAGLVVVGTLAAAPASGWVGVVGHVLLGTGLGAGLGVLTQTRGTSSATRRSLAGAGSMALLFVVGFLYYAAYDVPLGFDNRTVLFAAALLVAVLVHRAGRRPVAAPPLTAGRPVALGLALLVLLAGAGTVFTAGPREPVAGAGFPVRVMLYNVHMGFDTAGRLDTDALAGVIADQDADVVVLNEADRGWFLNGSHDVLQLIADELGMTYVFAPAADEIWGNAILSRFPIVSSTWSPLPRGGAPMARSLVSATIDLGDGELLAVVGTHLHHVDGDEHIRTPQAEVVAAEARRLLAAGLPVVVMGDMNAEPGDPELEPYLDAGLEDAVTSLADDVLTFPSWGPVEHIDHVLTSPDLVASDLDVPRSQASDHLGVAVTLDRP